MGNTFGDETSCESSTPLTYSTLSVLAPNDQWVLIKNQLEILRSRYILLSYLASPSDLA